MKTRTLDLAYEWGIDVVEVSQGMNGYPKGLYRAIAGFDTYEDAKIFADEIGGEVVLLSRRDGHQLWTNNGRAYEEGDKGDYWTPPTGDTVTIVSWKLRDESREDFPDYTTTM